MQRHLVGLVDHHAGRVEADRAREALGRADQHAAVRLAAPQRGADHPDLGGRQEAEQGPLVLLGQLAGRHGHHDPARAEVGHEAAHDHRLARAGGRADDWVAAVPVAGERRSCGLGLVGAQRDGAGQGCLLRFEVGKVRGEPDRIGVTGRRPSPRDGEGLRPLLPPPVTVGASAGPAGV